MGHQGVGVSGVYWKASWECGYSGARRGIGHHGVLGLPWGVGDVGLFWGCQGCYGGLAGTAGTQG